MEPPDAAAAVVADDDPVVVAVVLVFEPLDPHAARTTTKASERIRTRRILLLCPEGG